MKTFTGLTHDDKIGTIELMIVIGGGFASKIGEAYRRADNSNRRILENAFADMLNQYAEVYYNMAKYRQD